MNFQLPFELPTITFTQEATFTAFHISLVLLGAVLADFVFKSLIRVPKHFDNKRARSYITFVRNIITIIIYVIAIYIILTLLNINLTPLLASAGVIGVIIGISARSLIEDLLNGFFLLSLDSLAIGDYVRVDDDPKDLFIIEGIVERIGIRTTKIKSLVDGALYVVPNGKIKKFINYSRSKSSVQVDVIVKADQNIDKVLLCVDNALKNLYEDEELGKYMLPDARINGIESFQTFGFMTLRASLFSYPTRRLEIARKFRYFVKKEFEKHKILIG